MLRVHSKKLTRECGWNYNNGLVSAALVTEKYAKLINYAGKVPNRWRLNIHGPRYSDEQSTAKNSENTEELQPPGDLDALSLSKKCQPNKMVSTGG